MWSLLWCLNMWLKHDLFLFHSLFFVKNNKGFMLCLCKWLLDDEDGWMNVWLFVLSVKCFGGFLGVHCLNRMIVKFLRYCERMQIEMIKYQAEMFEIFNKNVVSVYRVTKCCRHLSVTQFTCQFICLSFVLLQSENEFKLLG